MQEARIFAELAARRAQMVPPLPLAGSDDDNDTLAFLVHEHQGTFFGRRGWLNQRGPIRSTEHPDLATGSFSNVPSREKVLADAARMAKRSSPPPSAEVLAAAQERLLATMPQRGKGGLGLNTETLKHAEGHVFSQLHAAGFVRRGRAVLLVDRDLCPYCHNGGMAELARRAGLLGLYVSWRTVRASGRYEWQPAVGLRPVTARPSWADPILSRWVRS